MEVKVVSANTKSVIPESAAGKLVRYDVWCRISCLLNNLLTGSRDWYSSTGEIEACIDFVQQSWID